ncbi:MAG: PEP-CTERM sorting domain-containing protein [Rubrivivax sp.]|jgi:hypothetical protein|nr:PEP-CTERM sorting domain-containing protein [Rubrivivax sp.]
MSHTHSPHQQLSTKLGRLLRLLPVVAALAAPLNALATTFWGLVTDLRITPEMFLFDDPTEIWSVATPQNEVTFAGLAKQGELTVKATNNTATDGQATVTMPSSLGGKSVTIDVPAGQTVYSTIKVPGPAGWPLNSDKDTVNVVLSVPEPSTSAMLALGVVFVYVAARKRQEGANDRGA